MKLLFLFLTFLITISPCSLSNEDIDKGELAFLDKVEKNYNSYIIYDTIEQSEFNLIIVKGIYNNTGSYGLYFIAKDNNYHLVLETESSSFLLNKDGIGYSAIAVKADINYTVNIYDKDNNKLNIGKIELNKFNKTDFDETSATAGLGHGNNFSVLSPVRTRLPFLPVLLVTFSSLILVIGLVILLLFIFKKGFFNKEKRKEGVISMRDIYEAGTNDQNGDGIYFDDLDQNNIIEENSESEEINYPDTPSTVIPLINPNKRDEDDESTSKISDVKMYLSDLGYITDYKSLSEEEKNKIMMELIKLKNDNQISMDDYYKETYELWKK